MLILEKINYKKKSHFLLNDVSGRIERGDSVTIFGPNGAGKSTLMQIMAGILKPTKGKRQLATVKNNPIGYVPQQLALFDRLTVKEHLLFYEKITKQKNVDYIEEMIEVLELKPIMKKRIDKLVVG